MPPSEIDCFDEPSPSRAPSDWCGCEASLDDSGCADFVYVRVNPVDGPVYAEFASFDARFWDGCQHRSDDDERKLPWICAWSVCYWSVVGQVRAAARTIRLHGVVRTV